MKGKTWLFWGGLIAAAGGVLFQTSYDVQDLEEKLAGLNRKIIQEQETIQILKAEWSYLNDPSKLEQMAHAYLDLQPTEARQFNLALEMIPMRPSDAVPPPALPGPVPLPPMVRAPGAGPQLAAARMPAPAAPIPASGIVPVNAPMPKALPMDKAMERAPVVVPASLPVAARIKPSALVPGAARAPSEKATADKAAPDRAAGKLPANAPTSPNRPTELASRPTPVAAPAPAPAKAGNAQQPHQPAPTDSLGLLVARLGANR
ncbi:cell division protein FtsL [Azospirillum picis]|uniref:Periplasmic protein TonB n=1 Tax=Azospirillum picis TaxID=488438 RepID=A0ABU0MIV5_9PROT|nr:hypothetical protein [Azospirillum picis]MBP2299483.1 hypothetical protein [Azospirillum picis]MDQ0533390.1 hypothetical protein [Azospirillum picis]